MKRFYCTICRRVKRVRVLPSNLSNPSDTLPVHREGTCSWHYRTRPGSIIRSNQPIVAEYGAMRSSVAVVKSKKSKGGK